MHYITSLIRTSFRLCNIGIQLLIILNCAILFGFITLFIPLAQYGWNRPEVLIPAFILFFIVYYAVVLMAGSAVIRLLFGNNRIVMDNEAGTIQVSFAEAYVAAKRSDPDLSDNIRLYVCNANYPDAYAFGRDTILISEPASRLSQNQLRVLLLQKFAQISNHDSERLLMLIAGNALFVVTIFLIKISVYVFLAIVGIIMSALRLTLGIFTGHVGAAMGFLGISAYLNVSRVLSNAIESVLLFFLNLLIRLALLSSQSNFFTNDRFVCECGYIDDLRYYLQHVEPDIQGFESTLATITASKPSRLARISRLQAPAHVSIPQPEPVSRLLGPNEVTIPDPGPARGFRVISRAGEDENRSQEEHPRRSGFRTVSRTDQ